MPQSYDVYFARMILTLNLVEREAIQGALHAYQQSGEGVGFPRWLVEHQFLDRAKVERVAQELERWFLAERRRAMGYEDPKDVKEPSDVVDPPRTVGDDSSGEGLEVPPDEDSETPLVQVPDDRPAGSSSRPPIPVPPPIPTPRSMPRPPAMPGAVPRATPPTPATPAASLPRPSATPQKPGQTPPAALPRPQAATPSASAPRPAATPRSGSTPPSQVRPEKKSSARNEAIPPAESPGESARLKKPSARVKRASEEAGPSKPRAASGRLKASGEKSSDKQWALFDKATKDPLTRLVGARLGKTEIVKLLQTGEVVTTFEGRHGDDERGAIVKVLRPDKVKDKVALERFTREAQALSKIDHPNIARILEAGVAEGVRFISMEVGSGEPLSVVLERTGRMPPERAARIARGVALGLAAAHRAGIIHRDLRPANVLVEEGGAVKLVGFGVARDVSVPGRLTATGHITGHPSYVAPEVAQQEEVTPKADVYSLGIVLFLALAGRLPFESRSVVKLVGLHLNAAPPKLAEIARGCPPRLAALVERLLAKNPDDRPDGMETANALAAKDLLDGFDPNAWKDEVKKPDTEEELRRAMATDEHPSVDESAERQLGGPACAACELPLGLKATTLHGNQICAKCTERVEALELCAACLLEIAERDAQASDAAVFAGHVYCRSCTRRVRLPCAVCKKEAPLAGLATGQTKAKGEQLVHATCSRSPSP